MRKKETERKFDDLADFSGVAEFLDTPMKRYSSGTYVPLSSLWPLPLSLI